MFNKGIPGMPPLVQIEGYSPLWWYNGRSQILGKFFRALVLTYFAKIRLFNSNVRLLLLATLVVGFTIDGGIFNVIFNLYLLRLGYGPEFIGQVNSAGLFAFALFSLPAGLVGARWGSRRVMIAGAGAMFVGAILLPLAEFSPANWQAGWLFATNITALLGLSLYFVNTGPFLMSAAEPEIRNHVFSSQVALWTFAAFAGNLIGGFMPRLLANILSVSLDQPDPYRYTLIFSAFCLIPAIVATATTQETSLPSPTQQESEPPTPSIKGKRFNLTFPLSLLTVLVVVRFLQVANNASLFTFFNVYMDVALQVPTFQIGAVTALGRLVAVPASLATPLLAARFGNGKLVVLASLGSTLGMLPIILIPHWAAAGLSFMAIVAASSIRFPTYLVFSMEVVSPKQRGILAGATETAAGLSFSAIALSGGYIVASIGYYPLFILTAVITALSAILFWLYFRKPRGTLAQSPHPELETVLT